MSLEILLVEDNKATRELIRMKIRILKPDADIETAVNGIEAVKDIENTPYDLIITDVEMPLKSGIDVLKHAKKRVYKKNTKKTTVFVMSARHEYKNEALNQGADVFLEKSLNFIKELVKHIKICFPN
ncbi:response regulator [Candidatus Parcubacteria bacterium]|nr:response regulator [Candidatus Parcubacteria bacterium]